MQAGRDLVAADSAAKALFVRWERLRILYNAILAGVLILALWRFGSLADVTRLKFWVYATIRGIEANIFFTLGPVAEAYAVWFLGTRGSPTILLFLAGTLLSTALTVYSAFWYSLSAIAEMS